MIKEIPEEHIMADYASTWCCMRWEREQTLVELLDMLAHIGTVDGADWEEVDLPTLKDVVRNNTKLRLKNPPTKGMDFYWGWSLNQAGQKVRMDIFFTTEKQATYYALAETDVFPGENDDAANILAAIKNRQARIMGGPTLSPPSHAPTSVPKKSKPKPVISKKASKILELIREASKK